MFDYPSVASAAGYLHGLMEPARLAVQPQRDDAITALTVGIHERWAAAAQPIRLQLAARMPESATAESFVQDAITTTPHSRCMQNTCL